MTFLTRIIVLMRIIITTLCTSIILVVEGDVLEVSQHVIGALDVGGDVNRATAVHLHAKHDLMHTFKIGLLSSVSYIHNIQHPFWGFASAAILLFLSPQKAFTCITYPVDACGDESLVPVDVAGQDLINGNFRLGHHLQQRVQRLT